MSKIEAGTCPSFENDAYDPNDPKCRRCTATGQRAVVTNPGSYFGINGGICEPLKKELFETKSNLNEPPSSLNPQIHPHIHS